MAVYANIYPEHAGRVMPDVLGYCNLTTGECEDAARGAVEAVYVDTSGGVNGYSYLAARGSLHGITEVFSDGALMATPGDYTVNYRDGGRTYIDFVANQGDNKITFNTNGYMFAPWNSGNGYVQNPAYIILFYLAFIVGVPEVDIDVASFITLATLYTALGAGESGKLIIQDARESEAVLQELLFSYGAKLWNANDGRLKIGLKDISNFSTNTIIFSQIDLIEAPERKYNLSELVNIIKSQFDYIPSANHYKQVLEKQFNSSIEDYDTEMESKTPYMLPWTDSLTLVTKRLTDDLYKLAHGDKIISFSVPIKWIDTLDIYINFRFQDPFGLSWNKLGEQGRYYYVISLEADYQNQIIDINAIDLQWLLGQYAVFGDRDELPALWINASEYERMYYYKADRGTGEFNDGTPGKIFIDRNLK